MQCCVDRLPPIAAFLAGAPREWSELQVTEHEFLDLCRTEDLSPLCFHRLSQSAPDDEWPPALARRLSEAARVHAAQELLRGAETRVVLDALTAAGLAPLLIKGTPIAYTLYDAPALRPREDTDVLIAAADIEAAQRVLTGLGYSATVYCQDLFSQFEMQKVDRFGVCHVFDVHWKISTQPVFDRVLTHTEMLPRAQRVPALGPHAMTAGMIDALLLACVHPVMHHRNEQRILWIYDVHLLAERLSAAQFAEFAWLARHKQIAAICAQQLRIAQTVFQTPVPHSVIAELLNPVADEPSAQYLESKRRWHDELASSVRGLPRVADRVKLLRSVLFPSARYMLDKYRLRGTALGPWLLPALYVHRNMRGAWKILAGKK